MVSERTGLASGQGGFLWQVHRYRPVRGQGWLVGRVDSSGRFTGIGQ